jgi:hypothetical protein
LDYEVTQGPHAHFIGLYLLLAIVYARVLIKLDKLKKREVCLQLLPRQEVAI